MKNSVRQLLLGGAYICPHAHPQDYEALQDPSTRAEVNLWLGGIDKRLARVFEDDGAFFMAPLTLGSSDLAKVKEDLVRFRDVYGPTILVLNLIRQTDLDNPAFQAGDLVQVAQLETAVSASLSLENQIRSLFGVVKGLVRETSNRVILKRLMEYLREEGVAILVNAKTDVYRLTGKVDQIHQVLEFISEHEPVIQDTLLDQTEDDADQSDLLSDEGAEHV